MVRIVVKHATWDALPIAIGRRSAGEQRARLAARPRDVEATRAVVTNHLGGMWGLHAGPCLASLSDDLLLHAGWGACVSIDRAPDGMRSSHATAPDQD